jgi:hypothetical protein
LVLIFNHILWSGKTGAQREENCNRFSQNNLQAAGWRRLAIGSLIEIQPSNQLIEVSFHPAAPLAPKTVADRLL